MGFWFMMMFFDLLIPITMIAFGYLFVKKAPKDINWVYGYRTSMSMKSKETWEFAHHYFGRLWIKTGWITLILSVIGMLFVLGKEMNTIENVGLVLCFIQMAISIVPIFPTEIALKKNFDTNGRRKK